MINAEQLLPKIKQLLPGIPDDALMAGIKEFAAEHPDLNEDQIFRAVQEAIRDPQVKQMLEDNLMKQSEGAPQAPPAAPQKPFEGLMNTVGGK